jgi:hypothetical protein
MLSISNGRMPEYQDRLRVELQVRGAADAQDTPASLERIAIINCASDGSRGFTNVRAVGVRNHPQGHDFGRWWSSNQQRRRSTAANGRRRIVLASPGTGFPERRFLADPAIIIIVHLT